MLIQQQKKEQPSTTDSFYTPNKYKNVSSIETNPSMNVAAYPSPINFLSPSVMSLITPSSSNFLSNPSYRYSNVQLSQSINDSPSFMSPNKEIGSFLITPNCSSNQLISRSQLPSEMPSQLRLKTESFIQVSKLQQISSGDDNQVRKVPESEVEYFMRLLQAFRLSKWQKQQVSKQLNNQTALNSHLTEQINQKQEDLLYHKKEVSKRIEKKIELKNKIKAKRNKIKQRQSLLMNKIQININNLRDDYYQTSKKVSLSMKDIAILEKEKQQCQQQLRQRSMSNQLHPTNYYHHVSYPEPHRYPHSYSPNQLYYPNPQQLNQSQYSQTKRVSANSGPNSHSAPNSSRSQRNNSQNSNNNSNSSTTNTGVLEILQYHLSKQFNQPQNQSNSQQNQLTQQNMLGDAIQKALQMKINGVPRQNTNSKLQMPSQQQINKPSQSSQFLHLQNISPIANNNNSNNKELTDKIQIFLSKRNQPNQNNSSVKKTLDQMMQSLSDKEQSPRRQHDQKDKSETQSQVVIDYESFQNYSDYKSKESQIFSGRKRQSVQRDQSPIEKGIMNMSSKKVEGVAKEFLQSVVNIMCQSSEHSNSMYRNHQFFSPRKEVEQIQKRNRSPTYQIKPKVHEQIREIRISQTKFSQSSKKSGNETPVFRSQFSDSQCQIKFSQPLLASMKNLQGIQGHLGNSQSNESLQFNDDLNFRGSNKKKNVKYSSDLIKIESSLKSSQQNKKKYNQSLALITIHDEQQPQQTLKQNENEVDIFSCSLNSESKILINSNQKSKQHSQPENISAQDKRSENQDIFQELRNTTGSIIQSLLKPGKPKGIIQQKKRTSFDFTNRLKKTYQFQVVPEQDEQDEDRKSSIFKKMPSKKNAKTTL